MRTPRSILERLCVVVCLSAPAVFLALAPVRAADDVAAKAAEKTFAFEWRDKPWPSVLEWLTDHTGIPVISVDHPKGTFTYISPRNQVYTVPQIIDIINEALVGQKYLLIRRPRSFTIVSADKQVDPAILPRITIKELADHGNTEMVSVVLPLKEAGMLADELAPEVKKMMGPFGEVVAMEAANQLILQDTVGNIRRIYKTIKDIEENETGKADSFTHKCKYIKATDAEKILDKLLGDPREMVRLVQQPQQQQQRGNAGGGGGFIGAMAGGQNQQQQPTVLKAKVHFWQVSADEHTNSVLVTGPANKIAQAKEILAHIDVGDTPIIIGKAELKTYTVPSGHAEALAKTLGEIYKSSSTTRVTAAGNDTLIVYAGPEDQIAIAKQLLGGDKDKKTELIPLDSQDATKTAETLKGMFGDSKDPKSGGGPYIEADTGRSAIVVRGSPEQVAQVKAALKALGEEGLPSGNMRVITLDKGSAATLAEALGRLLPQMRQNPVNVIIPGREQKPSRPVRPRPSRPTGGVESRSDGGIEQFPPLVPARADADQLVDPKNDNQKNDKPGKKNAPVTISAFGNRLIVTSDDPQALRLVQELTRLLTQAPKDAGDFEVIHLNHGNATDVAKVLDEAFNGTQPQQNNQPQFPPFFGGNRFGQPQQTKPTEDRVRVVADTGTNSLLVRATPLDMLTIRRLLDQTLDTAQVDAGGSTKTWVMPLKYASASDVADVIRDVYKQHIDTTPLPGQAGGFGGFRFALAAQAANTGKQVTLSVGVDSRSNSLVVSCSTSMHADIQKLVDRLDQGAKETTTKTVRVVPLKGVDPALVQRALDAIQGRRTTTTGTGSTGIGVMPGGIMMPGFGPGGMRGGGGQGGPPGGGQGGGGQGGGRPGGGGRGYGGSQGRGPDFFAERVKDDPEPTILYDPHQDESASEPSSADSVPPVPPAQAAALARAREHLEAVLAALHGLGDEAAEESSADVAPAAPGHGGDGAFQVAQADQPAPGARQNNVPAPSGSIEVEALPDLGAMIIRGNSPTDVAAAVAIIEELQKFAAAGEVKIQLAFLERADATSVANTLTQLFQRLVLGPTYTTITRQQTTTVQTPFGAQSQSTAVSGTVMLLPLPRYNAILVAAPLARMQDVLGHIKSLDHGTAPQSQAHAFQLKKASAARVATLLTSFYAQRYNETQQQDQVRFTSDVSSNTLYVQAAPADLAEITELVRRIDTTVSAAINDIRIMPLRNVVADELASILLTAINEGVAAPSVTPTPTAAPGAPGAAPGAAPGVGAIPAAVSTTPTTAGTTTKTTSLRFVTSLPGARRVIESGLLEDIHITADARINSLIISAPGPTMDLLLALVRELDVLPALQAQVNIFALRKADATAMATLLQQLFLGVGGAPPGTPSLPGAGRTGLPGAGGAGGGFTGLPTGPGGLGTGVPGAGALGGGALGGGALGGGALGGGALGGGALGGGALGGGALGTGAGAATLAATGQPGTQLIAPHITVDQRTNSVIVAASPHDLDMVEAIIYKLEDADIVERKNEVYHLRNAAAADVANAINSFLTSSLRVLQTGFGLTAFQEIDREVVVVPEPVSNKLLISATPRYYKEIMRIVEEMDSASPQVVVQAMIAEVDLTGSEEFGVELGLQSPVLFNRSIIPDLNFLGSGGSITYANPAGSVAGT